MLLHFLGKLALKLDYGSPISRPKQIEKFSICPMSGEPSDTVAERREQSIRAKKTKIDSVYVKFQTLRFTFIYWVGHTKYQKSVDKVNLYLVTQGWQLKIYSYVILKEPCSMILFWDISNMQFVTIFKQPCVFTAILIKGDHVAWTNHGGNNRTPRHFEL